MSPARRSAAQAEQLRASLLEHAQRIVTRDGAGALTMRGLATEAGCAIGLPYKVFAHREEIVAELIFAEFTRLGAAFSQFVARAGTGTVGANLGHFAELLLRSPAIGLAMEIGADPALATVVHARAGETGVVAALQTTVVDYLAAEKRLGRVDPVVDEAAFGFLIAGAVHNLLMVGDVYPRPSLAQVKKMLSAVARSLATSPIPSPLWSSHEPDARAERTPDRGRLAGTRRGPDTVV